MITTDIRIGTVTDADGHPMAGRDILPPSHTPDTFHQLKNTATGETLEAVADAAASDLEAEGWIKISSYGVNEYGTISAQADQSYIEQYQAEIEEFAALSDREYHQAEQRAAAQATSLLAQPAPIGNPRSAKGLNPYDTQLHFEEQSARLAKIAQPMKQPTRYAFQDKGEVKIATTPDGRVVAEEDAP
jgi:hypothetical protein